MIDLPEMDIEFMEKTYQTALSCGLPIISADNSARIMAVLYVHGNNEFMVHCPKFAVEMRYIQDRFNLKGAHIPNPEITALIRRYSKELEEYEKAHPKDRYPNWAKELYKKRYNITLIN